jgi:hypothetical protein
MVALTGRCRFISRNRNGSGESRSQSPSPDGTTLVPYDGPAPTIGGELNKVASNVAVGRNASGIHWRTDAVNSLRLGEEVAIGILEEQKASYNDEVSMTLTRFDGMQITI